MPKIKNIIIFIVIGAVFVLIYIFFIKPKPPVATLVSSGQAPAIQNTAAGGNSGLAQDFLNLLLNVKNIKLDDAIFSDNAFISLHDSSITLTPDGTEGRINPFAAFGTDAVVTAAAITALPTCTLPKVLSAVTNTCVNPTQN